MLLPVISSGAGVFSFTNAEAEAYVAAMAVEPDDTRKSLIDTYIGSLKAAGVFALMERHSLLAAHDAQAARIDLIDPSNSLSVTGTPSFSVDEGYTGNGTDGFLGAGVNWNALTKFVSGDASLSAWTTSSGQGANSADSLLGVGSGGLAQRIVSRDNTDAAQHRVSANSSIGQSPVTDGSGLTGGDRSSSANFSKVRNGAVAAASSSTEVAREAREVVLLRSGGTFGTLTVSAYHVGASMTPTQWLAYYNAIRDYMQGIGAFPAFSGDADLFMIAGQSNAEGRGSASSAPSLATAGSAFEYDAAGPILTPLADPVGGAATGSAWPAFANAWYSATGRIALFVEQATGGTTLHPITTPNWSPSGTLRDLAATSFADSLSFMQTNTDFNIVGKYVLWCQGETDAANLGMTFTAAGYQTLLEDLIDEWVTDLSLTKFAIFRTGTLSTDTTATDPDWAAIRAAQDAAQASRSSTSLVVFRGAIDFAAEGKMIDTLHYDQTGLNEMGAAGAANLAAGTNDT